MREREKERERDVPCLSSSLRGQFLKKGRGSFIFPPHKIYVRIQYHQEWFSWKMAVVSTDHADEKLCAEDLLDREDEMRSISVGEVEKHNGKDKKSFWGVIDGTHFIFTLQNHKTITRNVQVGS